LNLAIRLENLMSELSEEQLKHFEERLLKMREDVSARLRAAGESARPVDLGQPIGRLARMDAMQVQQMARTQRRRDETLLQTIAAAISRIRHGSYGQCLRCEEPIGIERLEVSPEGALCRDCRQSTES
jgi:DnaK suppressor protein